MKNASSNLQHVTPVPHDDDRIQIFLRECQTELQVGIYASEMIKPQPVVISVNIEAALPQRYDDTGEKKLDRVIDYERIYNFIRNDLPKLGHIHLLETVVEHIISFCLLDPRVRKVSVRLEKTAIFPAAAGAGVEITRLRNAGPAKL